jgi:RNA polymerase sigma factor (sigma-70 family)
VYACEVAGGPLRSVSHDVGRSAGGQIDEAALVARARAGDHEAFGRLVARHGEVAFRTAYLILEDAAEAEDATQEALLRAHGALGRFRVGAPLRPWLLSIVANEARNRRRARTRRTALAERAGAERRPSDDVAPSPEGAVLAAERRGLLLGALARLREHDRLVIQLRYLLELSEEETASVLGCRRGTVKSRLSRALERLREELGEAA